MYLVYIQVTTTCIVVVVVVVVVAQMYDVSSGKSYPAGYVSLNGHDSFTVCYCQCLFVCLSVCRLY